jgi:hypothetical protein
MNISGLAACFVLGLGACQPARAPADKAAKLDPPVVTVGAPVSAPPASNTPALFGAPFASEVPEIALAQLIADPAPYAGKIIETRGKVSQVCQAAGCWMELSTAGAGSSASERVRTPMAGHAFFVPKTIIGKEARVQGRVELIALSEPMKKHLEAEGASATGSALSISALSVAVR